MTRGANGRPEESENDSDTDPRPTDFKGRYGSLLVARGIATFPSLLLRFQGDLRITPDDLITIMWIFGFYRNPKQWPSVSIEKVAKARKVPRYQVEQSFRRLEAMGYVLRAGIDRRFRTYRFDASPLLKRLEDCAVVEVREAALEAAMRREKARLRARIAPNTGEASEQTEYVPQTKDIDIEDGKTELTERTGIGIALVSASEPALRVH